MLAGGTARQHRIQRRDVGQLGHHFFDAGDRDVNRRGGGGHTPVALVFHQAQGAGFGDREIDAADTYRGGLKFVPQDFAGNRGQGVDVLGVLDSGDFFREQLGDLFFVLVNRRHDDVTRRFTVDLDDVLA